MRGLKLTLFTLSLQAAVLGCTGSGGDTTDAGDGTQMGGSGNTDAVVQVNPDAQVVPDVNFDTDTGSLGADCNPIDGSGCGDQVCIFVGGTIGVQCRDEFDPPIEHEGECNRQLHNCRAGFACVRLERRDPHQCMKVCDRSRNTECESLVGSSPWGYNCSVTIDNPRSLGVCAPDVPECFPWDDMCSSRDDEYCEYTGGVLKCMPEGGPRVGQACPANRCSRGAICLFSIAPPTCYEPCDHADSSWTCSNSSQTCQRAMNASGDALPFGICR